MAAIYSSTGASTISPYVSYDLGTATASTATSGTTLLNNYIGTPMTQENLFRIRSTVNEYINTNASTGSLGIDYFNNSNDTNYYYNNTSSYVNYNGGYYNSTDGVAVYYDPYNRSLNVQGSVGIFKLTEEEKKEKEKREKEYQKLLKRQKIRSNLVIHVKSRNIQPSREIPENEQIAMETLRESITEAEFRKYLAFGFVLVEGKGGTTYQVFKNRSHTKVWKNGKVVEEICIRIDDCKVPPTDSVIAFRAMIKTSEEDFRKMGNVYNMREAA